VIETHTRVSSLDAVLEHLALREPYANAGTGGDPFAELVRARREEVERLIVELDLGYKLHCLAVKKP